MNDNELIDISEFCDPPPLPTVTSTAQQRTVRPYGNIIFQRNPIPTSRGSKSNTIEGVSHFSGYLKKGVEAKIFEELYKKVHAAICADLTPQKSAKEPRKEHKRYKLKKLTYDERRARASGEDYPERDGQSLCQGRFDILHMSGSLVVMENDATHNRSGGLNISLVSPDGRVIGGGVGGMLIAASPVQAKRVYTFAIPIASASWTIDIASLVDEMVTLGAG